MESRKSGPCCGFGFLASGERLNLATLSRRLDLGVSESPSIDAASAKGA